MDLRFNGSVGKLPDPESPEFLILACCSAEDSRVWRCLHTLKPREISEAIETLQHLGWGFEWINLQ
jgi:hypothetical protein